MNYKLCTLLTASLLLLAACNSERHERMQQQLAALQAMNQADSVLTDDSLAQALADWFDRHGTPNEQMEAHYLLGRTHADRGEAPAALAAYHDAIDRADTTAATAVLKDGGVTGYTYSAMYYDSRYNVAQVKATNHFGGVETISTKYSYTGKPLSIKAWHDKGSESTLVKNCTYTYDDADRLVACSLLVAKGAPSPTATITYEYDDLGRLTKMTRPFTTSVNPDVTYTYDLHGWTKGITTNSFREELFYADGPGSPCYNGNISSMRWENEGYYPKRGYKFTYDDANRLSQAKYGERDAILYYGKYSENMEYDANGNVTRISRWGKISSNSYGLMDNLTLSYDGNRLTGVSEAAADYDATGTFEYKRAKGSQYMYDANGSLVADKSRGIAYITYDPNNNPQTIYFTNGCMTKYTYSATGQKLSVVHYIARPNVTWAFGVKPEDVAQSQVIFAGQTDYLLCGSLIVNDGTIKRVLFDGGYASATRLSYDTYSFNYLYYNRDHLGNNREVVDATGDVKQVTNYYPFGAPYADAAATKGSAIQQYKYNGKELDVTHGLNTYDYGARQLDPILGRWDRMDPLCEKDYQTSPYVFCGNNPVNRVDKDGRIWDTLFDVACLVYDVAEAGYQYCKTGSVSNTTKAALGADALAAVVPGLTGTGLAVRAGARTASKTIEVAKGTEKALQSTNGSAKIEKLRKTSEIGKEAHRQIERDLERTLPGTKTEVTIKLSKDKSVRKDAVLPDGTTVIIKPDTKSGHKAAEQRRKLMKDNGYDSQIIYYDPNNPAYLPTSPTYIGPKTR